MQEKLLGLLPSIFNSNILQFLSLGLTEPQEEMDTWQAMNLAQKATLPSCKWSRVNQEPGAVTGSQVHVCARADTHLSSPSALGPRGIRGSSMTQSHWGTYTLRFSNEVFRRKKKKFLMEDVE